MQKKILIEINSQLITSPKDLRSAKLSKAQRKRLAKIFDELFEEERTQYVKFLEEGDVLMDELIDSIEKPLVFGFAEYQKATDDKTYDLGVTLRVRRKVISHETNRTILNNRNVIDDGEITREEHKFTPYNVLCITSENKDKTKSIYTIEKSAKSSPEIKCFTYNANYSMEQLCAKIDRLNQRLVQVSKEAVVNIEYFELRGNIEYVCNLNMPKSAFPKIMFSKTFGRIAYEKVHKNFKMQLTLPEKLIAYRSQLKAFLEK